MKSIEARTPTAAWLQAAQYLMARPDHRASRIVLEIADPIGLSAADRGIYELVDRFLIDHGGLPINTVANTIFPWGLYRRYGVPALYEEYLKMFPRVQKDCDARRWGTYFHRMIYRRDHSGQEINPLQYLIAKLNKRIKNRAAYELGVIDPFIDLPVYDPGLDKHFPLGGPCLSHLAFSVTAEQKLDLTALYRSHFYVQRALGNLFGLAHLLNFVAKETSRAIGVLTCISNTAQIDSKKDGWNSRDVEGLLRVCGKANHGLPSETAGETVKSAVPSRGASRGRP
jgi:hypothetical protein